MNSKRFIFLAALCALAIGAAGCGGGDDDNKTLSYDDTGTKIGEICDKTNADGAGLTGDAKNDAPKLDALIATFEDSIQEVRDLDVNEELAAERDAFADNGEQQAVIIKEAAEIAKTGNTKAYRKKLEENEPLNAESDSIASRLGADACID